LDDVPWFVEHSKLAPGKTFGELALINDDKRKATIVTVTNCSFAVLSKEDYKKILGKIEMKKIQQKIEFLNTLPFMMHYNPRIIQKMHYCF
jgi:CRP-like cAMP-binding protein